MHCFAAELAFDVIDQMPNFRRRSLPTSDRLALPARPVLAPTTGGALVENFFYDGHMVGSRRGRLPAVRTKIVRGLVENYGVGVAEIARQVGISTSGVSKILTRN